MIAAYTQIIKDNIEFEALKLDMGYQGALVDEIVELLVETVSVKREHICISGADYPYQLVKGKLLKLDYYSHIRYVIIGGLIGGLVAIYRLCMAVVTIIRCILVGFGQIVLKPM